MVLTCMHPLTSPPSPSPSPSPPPPPSPPPSPAPSPLPSPLPSAPPLTSPLTSSPLPPPSPSPPPPPPPSPSPSPSALPPSPPAVTCRHLPVANPSPTITFHCPCHDHPPSTRGRSLVSRASHRGTAQIRASHRPPMDGVWCQGRDRAQPLPTSTLERALPSGFMLAT